MFEKYLEKLVDALKEHLNKNSYIHVDKSLLFNYKAPVKHEISESQGPFIKFEEQILRSNNQFDKTSLSSRIPQNDSLLINADLEKKL